MKKLFTLLAALGMSVAAHGQCDNLIEYVEDKMEGTGAWMTKEEIIIGEGSQQIQLQFFVTEDKRTCVLNFLVNKSKCIDYQQKVSILYDDKNVDIINNRSKFNCNGRSTIYLDKRFGTMKHMDNMCSKEVLAVRVNVYDTYIEANVTEEQAAAIKSVMECYKNIMAQ